ncbi:hypothetical protein Tco_0770152 [Tanacetum coccineum]|uniref:Uncharacterized protein n=1 Tax=Tanacetum coccineum TaxID=301880 RepID=A0ABQ4ZCM3_9ASTR
MEHVTLAEETRKIPCVDLNLNRFHGATSVAFTRAGSKILSTSFDGTASYTRIHGRKGGKLLKEFRVTPPKSDNIGTVTIEIELCVSGNGNTEKLSSGLVKFLQLVEKDIGCIFSKPGSVQSVVQGVAKWVDSVCWFKFVQLVVSVGGFGGYSWL